MPRAPLDLGYTHEMAALPTATVPAAPPSRDAVAAHHLTARLRCLKALIDAERGALPVRRVH